MDVGESLDWGNVEEKEVAGTGIVELVRLERLLEGVREMHLTEKTSVGCEYCAED